MPRNAHSRQILQEQCVLLGQLLRYSLDIPSDDVLLLLALGFFYHNEIPPPKIAKSYLCIMLLAMMAYCL